MPSDKVIAELHDEKYQPDIKNGRSLGMPLDHFTKEAYQGLAAGKEEIIVGDRQCWYDTFEVRRQDCLQEVVRGTSGREGGKWPPSAATEAETLPNKRRRRTRDQIQQAKFEQGLNSSLRKPTSKETVPGSVHQLTNNYCDMFEHYFDALNAQSEYVREELKEQTGSSH
ncbi:MAG: hypothetical protein Q9217_002472 [Psora testacea]